MITTAPHLEVRDNGANIIGYELYGGIWEPRSCATGFFSTSGSLGNCCTNDACPFLTTCLGDFVYSIGGSANCNQLCGTGTIFHTSGDQNPLYMFNCNSNWVVTMTTPNIPGAAGSTTSANPIYTTPFSSSTFTMPASTSSTLPPNSGSHSSNKAGVIAGATIGGLAVAGAVVVAIVFLCLKQRQKTSPKPPMSQPGGHIYKAAVAPTTAPYNQAQYQPQHEYYPGLTGTTASPASPGQQWNQYEGSNLIGNQGNFPQELPTVNS